MLSLLPVPRDTETSDWFELLADVGRNRANRRDDTIKVESLLANEGDPELRAGIGPTGGWSPLLDGAIRRFQKRNGLKVDGWLAPGGPTIEALRERQSGTYAGFDVPTPAEIDAHHVAIAEGHDPLVAFASPPAHLRPLPGLPGLRRADRDSNASQLDWLDAHQVGLGEVPAQFARYVAELGPAGVAQTRDFVDQFAQRWPGERDALVDGILDRLDPQAQASFLGAPRPTGQPFGTLIAGMRRPGPIVSDLVHRPQDELPDHLARRTLEVRKGEEAGGEMPLAAAHDAGGDGTAGDDTSNDPQEAQDKRYPPNTPKVDRFFDDYSALAEKLAKELDTDPKYILSLMSLEGGWGDDGSRKKNNLFGFVKNGVKLKFESPEAAAEHFRNIWGPSVEGSRSMEEFISGLQDRKKSSFVYNNEKNIDYKAKLREQHESITRRIQNWRSGRST